MTAEIARPRSERCLSDLTFDEWFAGELDPERVRVAEAHLGECGPCRDRRAELERERARFLERSPALPVRRPRRHRTAWLGAAVAAAAGMSLLVSTWRGPGGPGADQDTPGTRAKGPRRLSFFVKRGEKVTEGSSGQQVEPGDQLRFVVSAARPSHVAILSLDGAGKASIYYPSGLEASRRLEAQVAHPLEDAIELDAVLGPERIFGVFCGGAFELEPLRRKLEAERTLVAPAGCAVDELELHKVKAQ